MLQMVKHIFLALICFTVCSCNLYDFKGFIMPTGDGVEKRFEQSKAICSDLKKGAINTESEYTFYVATDPHIEKTNRNLSLFNDILRNDIDASFGVILGDCTDLKNNLHKYLEALTYQEEKHQFRHEIFHILGNHDTYFNGWNDFKEMIGPSVYWFEVIYPEGKDLYISLDTATGTLGRKQTQWFKSFLKANRHNYRHCIILTHTNFFLTDMSQVSSGNMPIEESFALIDFIGNQNVTLVLQGHDHYREDLYYGNVRYTVLGTIKDKSDAPEYAKVIVNQDGIKLDWQYLNN